MDCFIVALSNKLLKALLEKPMLDCLMENVNNANALHYCKCDEIIFLRNQLSKIKIGRVEDFKIDFSISLALFIREMRNKKVVSK